MNKYIYFVEGECEEKLLDAIKAQPPLIHPGKVKVFPVIQKVLTSSHLIQIQDGTVVVLVFDTDVGETKFLKKNIELLKKRCSRVKIVYLAQVKNFEDEIVRSTDIRQPRDLTGSKSARDFKRDFCARSNVRNLLMQHHFDVQKIWVTPKPEAYRFTEDNAGIVKV